MAVAAQEITDQYAIYNGDCIEVLSAMPSDRLHFSIYSPPFAGLYVYSSNPRDISNNSTYEGFLEHYGLVVKELERVTMPGRTTAVHATDVPLNNTGKDAMRDFPGDVIRLHEQAGWIFTGRHAIWKEPLWVRNRTLTKSLAHKTIVDDSAYAGVASADQLLMFRKRGENPIPVAHPTGLSEYAGESSPPSDVLEYRNWPHKQTENRYSHWIWRQYASSVWDDIRMGRVLPFKDARDPEDEAHVHPLQLDVIERAITLRTNPGETVFTPFMGVGSEVYAAVTLGRLGAGAELKQSYYRQAVLNVREALQAAPEPEQSALFTEAAS